MAKPGSKWDYRDVSAALQLLRTFLLGRDHKLHNRFPRLLAPRTIPPPDIPRGPEYKYANQYYYERSASKYVKPPVVAPIAEGPPLNQKLTEKVRAGGLKPDTICFASAPTPGSPWWWDGHHYYEKPKIHPYPICPPPPHCPPSAPPTTGGRSK